MSDSQIDQSQASRLCGIIALSGGCATPRLDHFGKQDKSDWNAENDESKKGKVGYANSNL